jgi:hypothetical protein
MMVSLILETPGIAVMTSMHACVCDVCADFNGLYGLVAEAACVSTTVLVASAVVTMIAAAVVEAAVLTILSALFLLYYSCISCLSTWFSTATRSTVTLTLTFYTTDTDLVAY